MINWRGRIAVLAVITILIAAAMSCKTEEEEPYISVFIDVSCPVDGATDVDPAMRLGWINSTISTHNPDSYELYFGEETPPPLFLASTMGELPGYPRPLKADTRYYWKVKAKMDGVVVASTNVLTFRTAERDRKIWVADSYPDNIQNCSLKVFNDSPYSLGLKSFSKLNDWKAHVDIVLCRDSGTGSLLWARTLDGGSPGMVGQGERLVVPGKSLYCLDADNGEILWKVDHDREWGPPAIAGDRVYCASRQLYCFDLLTGELLWQYGDPGDQKNMAGAISIGGQYLVCREDSQNQLLCLDHGTGRLLWKQDLSTMGTGGPAGISATHVFRKTYTELTAYSLADGHVSWSYPTSGHFLDHPVFINGQVFCTKSNDQFVLLDAQDGQEIWTLDNILPFVSRDELVVVKGDNLYFDLADYIVGIDTKAGRFLWKYYINAVSMGMVPSAEGALLYTYSSGLTNIRLD